MILHMGFRRVGISTFQDTKLALPHAIDAFNFHSCLGMVIIEAVRRNVHSDPNSKYILCVTVI